MELFILVLLEKINSILITVLAIMREKNKQKDLITKNSNRD